MTRVEIPPNLALLSERLRPRLRHLYGHRCDRCLTDIMRVCTRFVDMRGDMKDGSWSERDAVLITYADSVRAEGEFPLVTLRRFLRMMELDRIFSLVHLLPFYPATSDDGFSVSDYRKVDPSYGSWQDIDELQKHFDLMFDLVLNHASVQSDWFQNYLAGLAPYTRYFVEADPSVDLGKVVRPRTSPLLTQFETTRGPRHLWTTFSPDQVDLNYAEPLVLVEMLDVLLGYIQRGARIIRLDAVAFLWKEAGTTSLHMPQTHEIVKLFRDVVETLSPGTLLLTETNVPHEENSSYWGHSDEAHLIYNFSLPPLLLDALLTGDATYLNRWLRECRPPPIGATFLNFTASHDGIGIRPLESLVPEDRIESLIEAVESRGGIIGRRETLDGRNAPYELNVTYFDALGGTNGPESDILQVRRFLASQAFMLSLRGIPAVYLPSLVGTPNNLEGVRDTGRARTINRKKFEFSELRKWIEVDSPRRWVWNAIRNLLEVRISHPAFHPDGDQVVLDCGNPAIVALIRTAPSGSDSILVALNVSGHPQHLNLSNHSLIISGTEIISGAEFDPNNAVLTLQAYQVLWLTLRIQPIGRRRISRPTSDFRKPTEPYELR